MDLHALQVQLRQFAADRDWDRFHSPKNLAAALAVEAAELLEPFQWLTEAESQALAVQPVELEAVREEMADVFIYLVRLADQLNVDLESAVQEKIELNARKYPISLAKGNAVKYNRRASDSAEMP